jgi:hypothetical protein
MSVRIVTITMNVENRIRHANVKDACLYDWLRHAFQPEDSYGLDKSWDGSVCAVHGNRIPNFEIAGGYLPAGAISADTL